MLPRMGPESDKKGRLLPVSFGSGRSRPAGGTYSHVSSSQPPRDTFSGTCKYNPTLNDGPTPPVGTHAIPPRVVVGWLSLTTLVPITMFMEAAAGAMMPATRLELPNGLLTTVIVRWPASVTPFTITVKVVRVPAVVPVNQTVYVPGTTISLTVPNVPALVPPDRVKPKALLLKPCTALPALSLTTTITLSVLPAATTGWLKRNEDNVALIDGLPIVNWSAADTAEVP